MQGTPEAPRCGFSARVVDALRGAGVRFGTFNILANDAVRQGLKALSDWPTYPQARRRCISAALHQEEGVGLYYSINLWAGVQAGMPQGPPCIRDFHVLIRRQCSAKSELWSKLSMPCHADEHVSCELQYGLL